MKKMMPWLIVISLIIAAIYIANNYDRTEPLTDAFVGAYSHLDSGGNQRLVSINAMESCFYYTYHSGGHYIRGQFSQKAQDVYLLWCDNEQNSLVIPQQEITLHGQQFTMMVDGQQLTFEKISQTPVTYGFDGEDPYS